MIKKEPIKKEYKNFLKLLLGVFILVLGVTLILVWWNDLMVLLRGILGCALAIGGLLVLYSMNTK